MIVMVMVGVVWERHPRRMRWKRIVRVLLCDV